LVLAMRVLLALAALRRRWGRRWRRRRLPAASVEAPPVPVWFHAGLVSLALPKLSLSLDPSGANWPHMMRTQCARLACSELLIVLARVSRVGRGALPGWSSGLRKTCVPGRRQSRGAAGPNVRRITPLLYGRRTRDRRVRGGLPLS